ncbi:phosphatidylinositol N-acetylglucosaminyltransferase subunit Y isoform X1 [Meriones unguiculatus]|uniref:phosphatidylinositol N-acetylglucosaminyltransferase subunit Y isoform X1 n=1 Tax=Meriones unguiculatus TaxID=10047 RepID=UPI00293F5908|nr:phosphatidylinositol N-acetylglucosaminyltransferase subunit Y isoform X1 [Meriones unguiculatus]
MSTRGGASSPELGVSLRPLQGLGRGRWAPRLRGAVTVTDRRRRDRASAGPRVVSSGSPGPDGRPEELLEPAGAGLRPPSSSSASAPRGPPVPLGSAGFGFPASVRLGSAPLGCVRPGRRPPRPARGGSGTPVPLGVPVATGPRSGAVFGLCSDAGGL